MTKRKIITQDQWENKIIELAHRYGVNALIFIPGVFELVSEELHHRAIMEFELEIP